MKILNVLLEVERERDDIFIGYKEEDFIEIPVGKDFDVNKIIQELKDGNKSSN